MIFFDFHHNSSNTTARSPLARLRQHKSLTLPVVAMPSTNTTGAPEWSSDEHADLLSRDKVKVKDAVKRYLASKVRNDWDWPPPPPGSTSTAPSSNADKVEEHGTADFQDETKDDDGYQVDEQSDDEVPEAEEEKEADDDADSTYSVVSIDPLHFRKRIDWDSDPNDDDNDDATAPDEDPHTILQKRRTSRRRQLREEVECNPGLACFEARRAAWTCARTVRLRVKTPEPQTPASPSKTPRRFFFRRSVAGSLPSPTSNLPAATLTTSSDASVPGEGESEQRQGDKTSQSTAPSDPSSSATYIVETIVPIPAPILPPNNALRQSIQASHYLQVYDKLVVNNLLPSCPINLADMMGACVAGWKRDGEWPPRPALPVDPTFNSIVAARKAKRKSSNAKDDGIANGTRRLSLTGLWTRDKDGEPRIGKGGVRQSLSRALGFGSAHNDSPTK